ncbi:Cholecystokinin receptor type A [Oryzias melastigma]|uniref:Cholecystokinin receptor type A n=1 Tax=Oryzias melastigma TaxID=30732 RepID=A0A834C305_ORYME|nr:Cholecystokinin receptor type A [Oryzias melastigma]
MLFLIPGIIMMTAYGLISLELYRGIKYELPKRKSSRDRQSSIKPGDSDGCYLPPSKRKSLTWVRAALAPPAANRRWGG